MTFWLMHFTRVPTQHVVQGGEDSQDALSCRSFSAKEPPIIGLFCGKWPMKTRHPMTLRHPTPLNVNVEQEQSNLMWNLKSAQICFRFFSDFRSGPAPLTLWLRLGLSWPQTSLLSIVLCDYDAYAYMISTYMRTNQYTNALQRDVKWQYWNVLCHSETSWETIINSVVSSISQ